MRPRAPLRPLFFPLVAVAFLSLATAPACAPSKQVQEVPVNPDAPLALELRLIKGPGLAGRLLNHSAAARPVLHDLRLQPSRVILVTAEGDTLEPFDRRSLMKFDGTLYCRSFHPLAPGAALDLGEARFARADGGWSLTWGPFEYEDLPAGRYTARLAWASVAADCQESREAEPRPVPGVWLGDVASNPVEVTLE